MSLLAPLALSLLVACGDKDDDPGDSGGADGGGPTIDQGVHGDVTLQSEWCELPPDVDVYEALADGPSCSWAPEFDTGFAEGHWTDNVGALVASPSVDAEGVFEEELAAGDYEVRRLADCYGCTAFSVVDGQVAEIDLVLDETIYADAPNLYLYPEQSLGVSVELAQARHVVVADPEYGPDGWQVRADPDGTVHHDGLAYDYLFYELRLPVSRLQRQAGWCVPGHLAQASIEEAMALSGFLAPEIEDFSDFWDAEWPEAEWMTVYPQTRFLGGLRIAPAPDALLRLWFVVEDGCWETEAPTLPQVTRTGFHAAEWGIVFDRSYERTWDLVR